MEIDRDLIAADSAPLALEAIGHREINGHAVIKRIREIAGGSVDWADGMFYPVLHRLERLGLLESRWGLGESGRRRKYYRIASRG